MQACDGTEENDELNERLRSEDLTRWTHYEVSALKCHAVFVKKILSWHAESPWNSIQLVQSIKVTGDK